MAVFNFPYHTVSNEYPESSVTMKYGGGYEFASKPKGPDQMTFKLNFKAMWFYTNTAGVVVSTTNPLMNMRTLELFYEQHRLYEKFTYPHPQKGDVIVRFKRPLTTPEGVEGAYGMVAPFTVELISQP